MKGGKKIYRKGKVKKNKTKQDETKLKIKRKKYTHIKIDQELKD